MSTPKRVGYCRKYCQPPIIAQSHPNSYFNLPFLSSNKNSEVRVYLGMSGKLTVFGVRNWAFNEVLRVAGKCRIGCKAFKISKLCLMQWQISPAISVVAHGLYL